MFLTSLPAVRNFNPLFFFENHCFHVSDSRLIQYQNQTLSWLSKGLAGMSEGLKIWGWGVEQ